MGESKPLLGLRICDVPKQGILSSEFKQNIDRRRFFSVLGGHKQICGRKRALMFLGSINRGVQVRSGICLSGEGIRKALFAACTHMGCQFSCCWKKSVGQ